MKTRVGWRGFRIIAVIVLLTLLVGAVVFFALSFLSTFPRSSDSSGIKALKSVEIKEYQGEKLSSIDDFLENSIKGPQKIDIKNYVLSVDGLVKNILSLSYDQVLMHDKYKKVVTLNCVEGWSVKILWEGVLLKDLLAEAGIKPGSNTVIFYAYDGYSSSLPLDYVMSQNIILADKMNGVVIPAERGFPFMVVAESKWGYKWVKWVTRIEVSSDPNFKGYWEKSGYSQNGDLNGPMFEGE
jgi:DMSO/TMAO reductase YedYZ molybdopterin-dependent catalytic subunit